MTNLKLLLVDWVDSSSSCCWASFEQLQERDTPIMVQTIGWLISENSKVLTLASSITDNDRADGDMTIPKSSIRRRKNIKT